MRIRLALIIVASFAIPLVLLSPSITLSVSQPASQSAVWHSVASAPRAMLVNDQNLAPLSNFYSGVERHVVQLYLSAEQALREQVHTSSAGAAVVRSIPPSAPVSYTSDASIWACIVRHESNGDPTAVNPSSGDGGLYQFNINTWLSPSIISITGGYRGGAQTAPASVQTQAALAYEAVNGWSAWRGDGCTPDG